MPENYIEPTQTEFDDAEQLAIDVINTNAPTVMTKTGSVIRELVIRPLSYLFAWSSSNIANLQEKSSVAYLMTSQATDNPLADQVASNYFVTRNTGTRSRGIITLTLNTGVTRIAQGSAFKAGDQQLITDDQIIVTSTEMTDVISGVTYVQSIPLGDSYLANIPVVATAVGKVEVPAGTPVDVEFVNGVIEEAELTSAITGGSDTETDASMMQRARYNTAESGIGSYFGLKKKFSKAPVTVLGLSVVAGEDVPMFRARYNNVNINPGGYVDTYLKTQVQPSTTSVIVTATKGSDGRYTAALTGARCAGFYRVVSVVAGGTYIDAFSVDFGTSNTMSNAEGSRLSVDQTATVTFSSTETSDTLETSIMVEYMPGISQLQEYIDSDTERFIGQDIKVKAAVPVIVSFDCAVQSQDTLSDADIALLKQAIADYVNTIEVGTKTINFSDIRKACQTVLPSAELRLPCIMSAEMILQDGTLDTFYTRTGILDIGNQANEGYWNPLMCFFSLTLDKIRIAQI